MAVPGQNVRTNERQHAAAFHVLIASTALVVSASFALSAIGLLGYGVDTLHLRPAVAALIPVGVDLLAICGIYATYVTRHAALPVRAYAWLVFGIAVVASIAGNEAHAVTRNLPTAGRVGAAVPPVILAMAVHLMIVTRREMERTTTRERARLRLEAAAEAAAGVPVTGSDTAHSACVYRAYADSVLLYGGYTSDIVQRIRQHRSVSPWVGEVTRWTYETYPAIEAAMAAEKAMVRAEKPKYNVKLTQDQSPQARATRKRQARSATQQVKHDPRAEQREQVRAMYAAGDGVSQIRQNLDGVAPARRTIELWTRDLREQHASARAERLNGASRAAP